jgi:catechol 2,3-dioxygenase-like lactoylglutathione lyase family enzyme
MKVAWLTACIDLPPDRFDAGSTFWQHVTDARMSETRGVDDQFVTLLPRSGDPYVRVQRTTTGPRIHLDLHVDAVADARRLAEHLGATVDVDLGHVIMRSPAGFTFCLVEHHGAADRPPPVHAEVEHRLDQVCIDVPDESFEPETLFWEALTGWELHQSQLLPEFAFLTQPPPMPLRLLLQRLGTDDGARRARAHLDIACGRRVDDVRRLHERFGAAFVAVGARWTTMRDPAGMRYCLTERDPYTGVITR